MASYASGSTQGSGTLGTDTMNASTAYTFTIESKYTGSIPGKVGGRFGSVSGLTLEGNSTYNQSLSETIVITGSFASFTGTVDQGSLIEDGNGGTILTSGAGGTFTFTPTTTINANKYFIRTVGNINLTIA